jgi:hypothetical protein
MEHTSQNVPLAPALCLLALGENLGLSRYFLWKLGRIGGIFRKINREKINFFENFP